MMTKKHSKSKVYSTSHEASILSEPAAAYSTGHSYCHSTFSGILPFLQVASKHDYLSVIKKGLQKKSLDHLMALTDITSTEMAQILHTTDRTLRRYTTSTVLNQEQSERVVELTRLYSYGEEVFGELSLFKEWMDDYVVALGHKKPKTFLDSSLGIEILTEELGRIEHGIMA